LEGEDADSLGLDGTESFDIPIDDEVKPLQMLKVCATASDGSTLEFMVQVRLDTPVEVEYYRNGGILHSVVRKLAE
jgi:aconitate hydratase